jgi:hypothetical protein
MVRPLSEDALKECDGQVLTGCTLDVPFKWLRGKKSTLRPIWRRHLDSVSGPARWRMARQTLRANSRAVGALAEVFARAEATAARRRRPKVKPSHLDEAFEIVRKACRLRLSGAALGGRSPFDIFCPPERKRKARANRR